MSGLFDYNRDGGNRNALMDEPLVSRGLLYPSIENAETYKRNALAAQREANTYNSWLPPWVGAAAKELLGLTPIGGTGNALVDSYVAYKNNDYNSLGELGTNASQAVVSGLLGSYGHVMNALRKRAVDVYHTSTKSFSPKDFDQNLSGSASLHNSADFPAMWTTRSPEVANIFAHQNLYDKTPIKNYGPRGAGVKAIGYSSPIDGANIMPIKAQLSNPLVIKGADAEKMIFGGGDWRDGGGAFAEFLRKAKEAGHDGVIIKANPRGSLEFRAEQYLLFDPKTQAKSKFE